MKNEETKIQFSQFAYKLLLTLVGILLIYIVIYLGTLIRNNLLSYHYIGKAPLNENYLSISAEGKVQVRPNIATITMGTNEEKKTIEEAQKVNTEKINNLVKSLKEMGIEEKDIKTQNYNVYPMYDYTQTGSILRGYQVSQEVFVKIRNVEKAGDVISLAGKFNLNQVRGLTFTLDDREEYLKEARAKALEEVREKKQILEKQLGLKLGSVVQYNENEAGQYNPYPVYYAKSEAMSMDAGISPSIESGEEEVKLNVNVTFSVIR